MRDSKELREKSKERFKEILRKKFNTVTIYPLSQFENSFGHLFGLGLPDEALTQEQKSNRVKWEGVREAILDMGNSTKRAVLNECDAHTIKWEGLKYQTEFVPVKNYKDFQGE